MIAMNRAVAIVAIMMMILHSARFVGEQACNSKFSLDETKKEVRVFGSQGQLGFIWV